MRTWRHYGQQRTESRATLGQQPATDISNAPPRGVLFWRADNREAPAGRQLPTET